MSQYICPDCDLRYDPACPDCKRDPMEWWMERVKNLTAELEEVKSYAIDRDMEIEKLRDQVANMGGRVSPMEVFIDATPEGYPVRILKYYRLRCDERLTADPPNPVFDIMNQNQDKRAEVLDAAIVLLLKESPGIKFGLEICDEAIHGKPCPSCGGTKEVCKTCGKNHFGKVYRHPYFLVLCKDCASNPTGKRFTDPIYICKNCGKNLECLHVQMWRDDEKAIKIHDCAHPCSDCTPKCDSCGKLMKKTGQVPEYGEEVGKPGSRIPVGMNELFECPDPDCQCPIVTPEGYSHGEVCSPECPKAIREKEDG